MFDSFASRHIGVQNPKDLNDMLAVIGVQSVDELIAQVIPASIRLKKPLALPREGMSEYAFAAHIRALADRNRPLRSFIGMGYYPCAVPAAVARNVFENPAWYTSYTPYQAEISQGRLEALLNFQTAVISLTGMQIGNCSLLDEGTATAEAMLMMFALRSREAVKEGRNRLFVDRNIFPQTLDVLLTRSEPFGIELIVDDYDVFEFSGKEFGAILQYPAADGAVRDYAAFTAAAHANGMLVTAVADLLALALLEAPGTWGADIVTGSTQRLGTPMGFGGPSAGYMTTREAFKRNMPGRIIGVSVDRLGHKALRMALQMREQHIKRERATSNICTASALMASMVGFYCVYNGAEGLLRAARTAHRAACNTARALEALGYKLTNTAFFDTLDIEAEAAVVQSIALEEGINFHYPTDGRVRLSFDEVTTDEEVEGICFAIPANTARSIYDDLVTDGVVKGRVTFGVDVATYRASIVYVTKVNDAASGTFEQYDRVVSIGDKQITSLLSYNNALATLKPDDEVQVTVYRGKVENYGFTSTLEFSAQPTTFTVKAKQLSKR